MSNMVVVINHVPFGRSSALTRNLTAETSSTENSVNGVGQSAPTTSESGSSSSKVSGLPIQLNVSPLLVSQTMNLVGFLSS